MSGLIHSQSGLHVACGLQVGHPCWEVVKAWGLPPCYANVVMTCQQCTICAEKHPHQSPQDTVASDGAIARWYTGRSNTSSLYHCPNVHTMPLHVWTWLLACCKHTHASGPHNEPSHSLQHGIKCQKQSVSLERHAPKAMNMGQMSAKKFCNRIDCKCAQVCFIDLIM